MLCDSRHANAQVRSALTTELFVSISSSAFHRYLAEVRKKSLSIADLRLAVAASFQVLPSRRGKNRLRVNQARVMMHSSALGWILPPVVCAMTSSSESWHRLPSQIPSAETQPDFAPLGLLIARDSTSQSSGHLVKATSLKRSAVRVQINTPRLQPTALHSQLAKRPPTAASRFVLSGCTLPARFPAHS